MKSNWNANKNYLMYSGADKIDYEHICHGKAQDEYSFHDAEELIYGELI